MKKFWMFLAIAACVLIPFTAMASENGTAEGNAVQNMDVSYSQEAGVQQITVNSVTSKTIDSYGINANGSGGLYYNSDPAGLAFVNLKGELYNATTNSYTTQTTYANLATMTGGVVMSGSSGASVLAGNQGAVTSTAGNSGVLYQTHTLPNQWGGSGTQTLTATGSTAVTATR